MFQQNKHVLICLAERSNVELDYIKNNFCGNVCVEHTQLNYRWSTDTILYLTGNIGEIMLTMRDNTYKEINIIRDFSINYGCYLASSKIISIGQVPIKIHLMGVYLRDVFGDKKYFESLALEHQLHKSYGKNIYISNVQTHNNEIRFRLLRGSTNIDGPTENMRTSDHEILVRTNDISSQFFGDCAKLNHISVHIENNCANRVNATGISRHSDKTMDMPRNGLIAFCSFYKNYDPIDGFIGRQYIRSTTDMFDHLYKGSTVLSILRFRLKASVVDPYLASTLTKQFDVTLYPNSLFIMSLTTNRLYTHEIISPSLPIDILPTRMTYVMRCSNVEAVYTDNQVYITETKDVTVETRIPLVKGTYKDIDNLKNIHYKENNTDELMNYGKIYFSMNLGDYQEALV